MDWLDSLCKKISACAGTSTRTSTSTSTCTSTSTSTSASTSTHARARKYTLNSAQMLRDLHVAINEAAHDDKKIRNKARGITDCLICWQEVKCSKRCCGQQICNNCFQRLYKCPICRSTRDVYLRDF